MELLTIIVESEFGADAGDLWCMDLVENRSVQWPKSRVRTRQACRDAAKHLRRMIDARLLVL